MRRSWLLLNSRKHRQHAGIAIKMVARDFAAGKKTDQRHIAQGAVMNYFRENALMDYF